MNFLWVHTQQTLVIRWLKMLPTKAKFYMWWHHQLTWVSLWYNDTLAWLVLMSWVYVRERQRQTESCLQNSIIRNGIEPAASFAGTFPQTFDSSQISHCFKFLQKMHSPHEQITFCLVSTLLILKYPDGICRDEISTRNEAYASV